MILLLKESAKGWSSDKCSRLGAALAYYSIFSLAPLLVITIAVTGLVFGEEATRGEMVGALRGLVGDHGAKGIEGMIQSARKTW